MGTLHERSLKRLNIWEHCTVDEAEQSLTEQDKPKNVAKMTPTPQKVIAFTQKQAKSYPHFLCINGVLVYGNTARSYMGTLHGAKNDQNWYMGTLHAQKIVCGVTARLDSDIWERCTNTRSSVWERCTNAVFCKDFVEKIEVPCG